MAKAKTIYVCSKCGTTFAKWMGQCSTCHSWNTLEETEEAPKVSVSGPRSEASRSPITAKIQPLKSVSLKSDDRLVTGISELDRVLGGGLVKDSISIIAAKPGAGKSTLLLQIAENLSRSGCRVLYVSGEESESQMRRRAERILSHIDEKIYVAATAHLNEVLAIVDQTDPDVIILDSIQTFYMDEFTSRPGTPTQVTECTGVVMKLAKNPKRPRAVMMAGQLTKEDELAGVRSLEHMVDTVLFMEADPIEEIRTLSATKNRFGSTGEMGFFTMEQEGLIPIDNPSRFFMTERKGNESVYGSVLAVQREGTRPMIIEIESLISQSYTPYPTRISEALSRDQMGTLISILEQRGGIPLYDKNVVIKSTGGLRLSQPSINLGVILSLASSALKKGVRPGTVFIGDVGLTGELKKVPSLDMMVQEVSRLGFTRIYVPSGSVKPQVKYAVEKTGELLEKRTLQEVIRQEFGDYRKELL